MRIALVLAELIDKIRTTIKDNPDVKINDLEFMCTPPMDNTPLMDWKTDQPNTFEYMLNFDFSRTY